MISRVLGAHISGVTLASSGPLVRPQIWQLGVHSAPVHVHVRVRVAQLAPLAGVKVRRRSALELDVRGEAIDAVAEAGVEVERKAFGDET